MFIVVVVAEAVIALYIFVSNAFTADIMILLLLSVAALIIFTVYLFILKLTEFTKRAVKIDMVRIFNPKKANKNPALEENYYERQLALKGSVSPEISTETPPPTSHRPVFEKKEESPEKKRYKPVFGGQEDDEE